MPQPSLTAQALFPRVHTTTARGARLFDSNQKVRTSMPRSMLKSALVYDADATAKRINCMGSGLCLRQVRVDFSNL